MGNSIHIAVRGGKEEEFVPGIMISQAVQELAVQPAAEALAARVDGTLLDLSVPLYEDSEIELVFPGERTLDEIAALSTAMEEGLAAEMPGLTFRIIPVGPGA